jgi:hypothetical protein
MIFKPVDWDEYNRPPFLPEWMRRGETLDLANFDDGVKADTNRVINAMAEQHDLEKAKGILLDRAGKLLNQPRKGQDDERYRSWLRLKAMINNSTGTVNEIIDIIEFVYQAANINLEPDYPAGLKIRHDGEDSFDSELNKRIAAALPAGISYTVTEIFSFIDELTMSDDLMITAIKQDQDVYPAGLRLDGRINLDHGRLLYLNGKDALNGAWTLDLAAPAPGTVRDMVYIPSNLDGTWPLGDQRKLSGNFELYAPEAIDVPATLNSGQRDELSMHLKMERLEDRFEIFPYLDGSLSLNGLWNLGEDQPSMIDNPMTIKITQHLKLNGKFNLWVRPLDGSIKLDGSAVLSSGETLSGDKITFEEVI